MKSLRRYDRILVWGIVYLLYVYMANDAWVGQDDLALFLETHLFHLQRYYFVVSIFFITYLYILKKPFTSPLFVTRSKPHYLRYVILHGLKLCGIYLAYTLLLFAGLSLGFGLTLQIRMDLILQIVSFFCFLFATYLFYLFLLLKSEKQMLSLLTPVAINFILLIVYFALGTARQELAWKMNDILLASYPFLVIVMVMLLIFEHRRKEFLS